MADAYYSRYSGDVDLTITHEEAKAVRFVLARVAGDRDKSARQHTESVLAALNNVLADVDGDLETFGRQYEKDQDAEGTISLWKGSDPSVKALAKLFAEIFGG